MRVRWHLGTMGFGYKEWIGSFYPDGLPSRSFLAHYSQFFDSVEIDSTFYGPPRIEQLQKWYQVTPTNFTFCLKTPRQITHDQPLSESIDQMMAFLDVVPALKEKLGPILIQFAPSFTVKGLAPLEQFLSELPTTIRYAVEFRHPSWVTEETAVLLKERNICWVSADYIHLPKKIVRTTDFLYLRFIGPHGQFAKKGKEMVDMTPQLKEWMNMIEVELDEVRTVHAYFNNDFSGHSPATCNRFKRIVGLPVEESRPLKQGRLF